MNILGFRFEKEDDVVEKFRKFFKGLSKGEKQDMMRLMSAFRGPDINEFSGVKKLLTAKVRRVMMGIDEAETTVNKYLDRFYLGKQVNFEELRELEPGEYTKFSAELGAHFAWHLQDVVGMLMKLGYK